jgi:hypothetical protein
MSGIAIADDVRHRETVVFFDHLLHRTAVMSMHAVGVSPSGAVRPATRASRRRCVCSLHTVPAIPLLVRQRVTVTLSRDTLACTA